MYEGTRLESDPPQSDFHSRAGFVVGTPEEAAAELKRRTDGLPVKHLFTWADHPGIPDELIDRHIELVLTKVAPVLRETTPGT